MDRRVLPLLLLLACGRVDHREARLPPMRDAADARPGPPSSLPPINGRTPEVALLLGKARLGEPVAPGWTLVDADDRGGSVTVTLRGDDGHQVVVEAYRKGSGSGAPVTTTYLDYFVMDGTNRLVGAGPTDCSLIEAVQAFASAPREAGAEQLLAGRLTTLAQRQERFHEGESPFPPPLPLAPGNAVPFGVPVATTAPAAAAPPAPSIVNVPIVTTMPLMPATAGTPAAPAPAPGVATTPAPAAPGTTPAPAPTPAPATTPPASTPG